VTNSGYWAKLFTVEQGQVHEQTHDVKKVPIQTVGYINIGHFDNHTSVWRLCYFHFHTSI